MDDIPLADVVTAQPTTRSLGGGHDENNPTQSESGPVLSGTGPLKTTDTLLVKQRIRAFEILSLCTGCEVEKKYNIYGPNEEVLYTARERSQFMQRCFCGSSRSMSLEICDQTNRRVVALRRPLNCAGLCCGVFYPHCTQELKVVVNEETAGVVRERATWCYPVYHIFDGLGSPLLKVRGPLCHYGCCGNDVKFQVLMAKDRQDESNERQVATITKKWGGLCTETLLEADSFLIEYHDRNLSVEEKALVLSSAFLIDLNYFEAE